MKVPGSSLIGGRIALVTEEIVNVNQLVLSEVLDLFSNKATRRAVPDPLCCEFREQRRSMLDLRQEVLVQGPGGLFLAFFEGFTLARPRVVTRCSSPWHYHTHSAWEKVSSSVAKLYGQRNRYASTLNAKVWDAENFSSSRGHRNRQRVRAVGTKSGRA